MLGKHPYFKQKQTVMSKLKVMYFSAPWCGPCRAFGPAFDEVVKSFDNEVDVQKINIDEESDLASENAVRSIPTIIFKKGDVETFRQSGAMPKTHLELLIKTHK